MTRSGIFFLVGGMMSIVGLVGLGLSRLIPYMGWADRTENPIPWLAAEVICGSLFLLGLFLFVPAAIVSRRITKSGRLEK
jgi:predicted cobalt transporter CbtA